jgi:hypothetical protein
MSSNHRQRDEFSTWNETGTEAPAQLVPAERKRLEVNGEPVDDPTHEFRIDKKIEGTRFE